MISCRDAKHLFDRYLDGELNPSLQAELHAHRLACTECQNELALLEACGDVISMDRRREPTVSASFTDRVLLARRGQMRPVVQRRRLVHTLFIIGSPLAAAACLAMMFSLFRSGTPNLPTAVAGAQESLPRNVRVQLATHKLTSEEQKLMDAMPVSPAAGGVEELLALVVEKSKNATEGARRAGEDVLERLHEGISTTSQKLAVEWRYAHPESNDTMGPPVPSCDQSIPDSVNSESQSPTGEPIHNPY